MNVNILIWTKGFDVIVTLESNVFGDLSHQSTVFQYIECSPIEIIIEIVGNHSNVDEVLIENIVIHEAWHQKCVWPRIPPTALENSKVADYKVESNIVKGLVQTGS